MFAIAPDGDVVDAADPHGVVNVIQVVVERVPLAEQVAGVVGELQTAQAKRVQQLESIEAIEKRASDSRGGSRPGRR